jgi:hypothetical protein
MLSILRLYYRWYAEQWVKWEGKTEVLRENLLERHFIHHKSHINSPRSEPGGSNGKLASVKAMARPKTKTNALNVYYLIQELINLSLRG